jgi:anti-anti-sigma factor
VIHASPFEIDSHVKADSARLTLSGELDIATVPRLEEAVASVLAQGARRVVIDLSPLAFVDSSGLRMLIAFHDRAAAEGWSLALVRPAEPSLSVFQITGAEENLPFIDDPPSPS